MHESGPGPSRVKTLRGITAPGILRLVVTLRAKKCKNSSSAQRYNQIRFRFHTAWANSRHRGDLFNDLVGHCKNLRWQIEAERFRGFKIDHELKLGCLQHW